MSQPIVWPKPKSHLLTARDISGHALWYLVSGGKEDGRQAFFRDWKHKEFVEQAISFGVPHVQEDMQ